MRARRLPGHLLIGVTRMLSRADRDEMAIPSYSHPIPIVRWLFWSRLDAALLLAAVRPGERIIDFGVGSGVLLPSLAPLASRLVGFDLHIQPARAMAELLGLSVELLPMHQFGGWVPSNSGSFDCIFALDVLEHVEETELGELSDAFVRLLAPGGRLVVSGATETLMYRIGRAVAGFHGGYHHRSIFDLDALLVGSWLPKMRMFLPPRPLPRAFMLTRYEPARGRGARQDGD